MVSVSALPNNNAMALPAQREWAKISADVNPKSVPMSFTLPCSVAVRSAEVMVCHLLLRGMAARRVWWGALLCQRARQRWARWRTRHAKGWPERLCPMASPLTPFFCVMKTRCTCERHGRWSGTRWMAGMRRAWM
eukprot:13806840-Ditylum_brightwellii.AAC.1